jgi:hypothetical protein
LHSIAFGVGSNPEKGFPKWGKEVKEMELHEKMMRIFEVQEEELKNIRDIGDYLNEEVLEIKREQSLSYDGWTTSEYTLVTGIGGPHVEFTTNYSIHVYWDGKALEMWTYDQEVRDQIDKIEEYLDEL